MGIGFQKTLNCLVHCLTDSPEIYYVYKYIIPQTFVDIDWARAIILSLLFCNATLCFSKRNKATSGEEEHIISVSFLNLIFAAN